MMLLHWSSRVECRDLTCTMSRTVWKHWQRGACACRQFRDTPGRCPGGHDSVPPLHNELPAEAHWGPLMWGGDGWDESLWKKDWEEEKKSKYCMCKNMSAFWSSSLLLSFGGNHHVAHLPLLDVLQHSVGSFPLIQPRVSAVPHQLAPLYSSLHQKTLECVIAQEPELLKTQQTCTECKNMHFILI